MKYFLERRYGIVIHWTFRSVEHLNTAITSFCQPFHENIPGLWRWLWWDLVRERFYIHYEDAGVPFSHDVLRMRFGPWWAAWRRASRSAQLNGEQHSRWLLVRLKLPGYDCIYRGGWVRAFADFPPIEDIASGYANPGCYPEIQSKRAKC